MGKLKILFQQSSSEHWFIILQPSDLIKITLFYIYLINLASDCDIKFYRESMTMSTVYHTALLIKDSFYDCKRKEGNDLDSFYVKTLLLF